MGSATMRLRVLAFSCLFLIAARNGAGQAATAQTRAADQEIQLGELALRQGSYAEAKRHFERAEELAGEPSAVIHVGIAMSELQMGRYEVARQREAKALPLLSDDHARAEAHNVIGTAWLRESAVQADKEKLRAAEDSFRQAVKLDSNFDSAYFNLGETLLRESREGEAATVFRQFVEAASKNAARAGNLPLAPAETAPAFRFADVKGKEVSAATLRGRFVLLDFWATWCPPCIRALPVMRQLAYYFPHGELMVVSVNEDSHDEQLWRTFVAKQNMDWTQVRDKDGETYFSFGLSPRPDLSIPRYVLLDGNNSLRRVYSGTDRLASVAGEIVRTVEMETVSSPPKSAGAGSGGR